MYDGDQPLRKVSTCIEMREKDSFSAEETWAAPDRGRDAIEASHSAIGSGGDPLTETADFFRAAREHLSISKTKLALRIDSHPDVVTALETARVDQLPDWPETERVVCNYAKVLSIDPRPALHILKTAMALQRGETDLPEDSGASLKHTSTTGGGHWSNAGTSESDLAPGLAHYLTSNTKTSAFGESHSGDTGSQFADAVQRTRHKISEKFSGARIQILRQRPVRLAAFTAVFAAVFFWIASQGWFVRLAQSNFPGPVASMVRTTNDFILYYTSPRRDGLRWIEVEDPRSRRTDKLPVSEQSN